MDLATWKRDVLAGPRSAFADVLRAFYNHDEAKGPQARAEIRHVEDSDRVRTSSVGKACVFTPEAASGDDPPLTLVKVLDTPKGTWTIKRFDPALTYSVTAVPHDCKVCIRVQGDEAPVVLVRPETTPFCDLGIVVSSMRYLYSVHCTAVTKADLVESFWDLVGPWFDPAVTVGSSRHNPFRTFAFLLQTYLISRCIPIADHSFKKDGRLGPGYGPRCHFCPATVEEVRGRYPEGTGVAPWEGLGLLETWECD